MTTDPNSSAQPGQERIAKRIAAAGICSRREAERLIEAGRVTLNGRVQRTPAITVSPSDRVEVDGAPLESAGPPQLWRYHKPRGLITTHRDPQGRDTVFDALPRELPRVVSVGRLDLNTEGLLLLTTSGALARHLELPSTAWLRRYRVRAHGQITQQQLDKLQSGLTIDGVRYAGIEARLDGEETARGGFKANIWLTMALREGKNREIRKVLSHLDLEVNRLIRISYGPLMLGDLAPRAIDEVRPRIIADQLGATVAASLGLDARARRVAAAKPQRKRASQAGGAAGGHSSPSAKRAGADADGPRGRQVKGARKSATDTPATGAPRGQAPARGGAPGRTADARPAKKGSARRGGSLTAREGARAVNKRPGKPGGAKPPTKPGGRGRNR
ncbi:MAG: pseudouridine synthase [Pseudomonadota bacterium]